MTNAVELQTAIEDAYGLLWLVVTDDPRLHAARARLLSKLDRDGQRRGIQVAKNTAGSTTMAEILQIDLTPAPEIAALREENERLREALWPFAKVAEKDIGETEDEADLFVPPHAHNRAPRLVVGDFRRARAAAAPQQEEAK